MHQRVAQGESLPKAVPPIVHPPCSCWFLLATTFSNGKLSETLFLSADTFTREPGTSHVWKHAGYKKGNKEKTPNFAPSPPFLEEGGSCPWAASSRSAVKPQPWLSKNMICTSKYFDFLNSWKKKIIKLSCTRCRVCVLRLLNFCCIILASKMPRSCLPAFFPRDFHLSAEAQRLWVLFTPSPAPKTTAADPISVGWCL